jgi:hypothetical protein
VQRATVPLSPVLRRLLVAKKLRAPFSRPDDLVVGTADVLARAESAGVGS